MGRRILITGLASLWGGRMAEELEARSDVDVVVGIDTREPVVALERTEFVRADESYSILARLVRATEVDTVVHAGLVVDSTRMGDRRIHEQNVIGTLNLLAAVSASSTVRSVVVKASTLVFGSSRKDPYWFAERTPRVAPVRTRIERSLMEVESYLAAFVEDNKQVRVATLRYANVLGPDIDTPLSKALTLAAVPRIAGFDPQFQFVSQDDIVRSLTFAVDNPVSGVFNVAGQGRLPWSEMARVAGRPTLPLSPVGTGLVAAPLARLGVDLPPEVLDLLRYGRGVDTTKLRAAGFVYNHSTLSALRRFVEAARLRATVGETSPTYRYQTDVEAFFRHSPAVTSAT